MGVRFSRACLSKDDGRPPRARRRASHALPAYGRSSLVRGGLKFTDVSSGNRANPSAPADQALSKYQTFHWVRRPARPAARWRAWRRRSDES